jgi:hypothetical protein
MMHFLLDRKWRKDTYTIGRLYVNGEFLCNTIEDVDRNLNQNMSATEIQKIKVMAETAIPTGTYAMRVSMSPKFKRELVEIVNVPAFSGIRIHRGNTAQDSAGCVIVGENTSKGRLTNSTKYELQITEMVKKADYAYITII